MNEEVRLPGDDNAIVSVGKIYLTAKRKDGVKSILERVMHELENWVGEVGPISMINDESIRKIIDKPDIIQRVFINKYFIDLLLVYRGSVNKTSITDLFPYLSDGVSIDDWLDLLKTYVIPFLKIERVYDKLFIKDN